MAVAVTIALMEVTIPFNSSAIIFDWEAESSASFLISSATTEKPFPVSPAWAASMAAFMASRFVWLAMVSMTLLVSSRRVDWLDTLLTNSCTVPMLFLPSVEAVWSSS